MKPRRERTALAPRLPVTRYFESSRHAHASLASAFEHAMPIHRRSTGREPALRTAAVDLGQLRRAVS
jgi:hypothetical protein